MHIVTERDPGHFLERAGPFLARYRIACNVIATMAASAAQDPAMAASAAQDPVVAASAGRAQGADEDRVWFLVADDPGEVAGVAMHTPPFPLALAPMPPGGPALLAAELADVGRHLPGVSGTVAEARAFAAAWAARVGVAVRTGRGMRMYELDRVITPEGVPGRARPATAADRDLLVEWTLAFAVEAAVPAHDTDGQVRAAIGAGLAHLWTVDGEPVSYAAHRAPAAGVSRVGPVFTPRAHRRRGYAGALTAEVSRRALAGGAETCMLYTDLANPTSNAVYRAVGYRPVGDALEVDFDPA